MVATLHHRGPDARGLWVDASSGIALGHTRLSIVDLSEAGAQPMLSAGQRYVMVFNGEIYNHLELRAMLASEAAEPAWRGHSDTETLLAGFEHWGVELTLTRAVGMFALALWDRNERGLVLARDRLGEKPLYYGWQGDALLFGSELKALRAHPRFQADISRDALALFFRHGEVPESYSIYEGIHKLVPGTWLRFNAAALSARHNAVVPTEYWSLREVIAAGRRAPFSGSPSEAVDELQRLLRTAVAGQMMADVPLGAFLSGGVDSSAIVALMQSQSAKPIKTFTIGFHEAGFNEAEHAKGVARHLGTEHTESYVTAEQAQAVVPLIPGIYDEPFADSSQIPTFLVSRLARQKVTVSLSGDAGDELFGGYSRYALTESRWSHLEKIPFAARTAMAALIRRLPPDAWARLFALPERVAPARLQLPAFGDRLHKVAGLLSERSLMSHYRQMVSIWPARERLVLGSRELPTRLMSADEFAELTGISRMMALDTVTYLPDDILVKVDRASMGVSLESRVPLLDHRVVEFAWRLPFDFKVRAGVTKWILREVLYKHVPRALIERPKMGFGVPIDAWLRGALRGWAEDLLNEDSVRRDGYLDSAAVRTKWKEHLSGRRNWQDCLWAVLMFQQWRRDQVRSTG